MHRALPPLVLTLAACGAPHLPAPTDTSSPSRVIAPAPAPICGPLDIPELAPTGPVLCELASDDEHFELSTPGGVVFASGPAGGRVQLTAAGAFARVTSEPALTLAGYDRAIRVRVAKPIVVGGYIVPAPDARHRWTVEEGKIRIDVAPRRLAAKSPPTARVDCKDLSLRKADFDPAAALPPGRPSHAVVLDRPVHLSTAPGAAPVAMVPQQKHLLQVLDTRGPFSLVRAEEHGFHFFGWVSSSAVPPRQGPNRGEMYGAETCCTEWHGFRDLTLAPEPAAPPPRPAPREISCRGPVRLVVEVNGERFVAGVHAAPGSIRVWSSDEALTELDPRSLRTGLITLVGARWLVPTCDLARCM